jgi:hypothetical protein
MSRLPEQRAIEFAAEALVRMADATDAQTEQALNSARRDALRGLDKTRTSAWLWATATAAVLALAVATIFLDGNGEDKTLLAQQPVADAELYRDMEFYLWLSEQLESE